MTADEAKARGYEVIVASAAEVGLVKHDRGVRTWWARDFNGQLPPLDHPKIQEAIAVDQEYIREQVARWNEEAKAPDEPDDDNPDPIPLINGMAHYGWRKVYSNEFRSAGEEWWPPPGTERQWIPVYVRQAALLEKWERPAQQEAPAACVYLVATGETYEGRETYTRWEDPPLLCDAECLYAKDGR